VERKLKITLCVLIVILISIIAFVGVYSKNIVSYESALPEYLLGSEFTGKRVTYFKVNTDTNQKIYDKDGNEVNEIPEGANEADYKKEDVKINADENLTTENYNKVKNIFEGRLKELGVSDYSVRVSEVTGEAVVELADDENTDKYIQYLLCKGDFSMKDSEDGTILMDKSNIKKASVVYGRNDIGQVEVYLNIKFNKEGAEKLTGISKNYLKQENTISSENSDNTLSENEVNEVSNNETKEDSQKKVTITIEGSEFLTTYFAEEMNNGELTVSLGTGSDNESVYKYATQAGVYAMLLNNEEMPIEYKIETSQNVAGNINSTALYVIIGIVLGISIIVMIYMIVKFKADGLLSSIAFIGGGAIFLLIIRYTRTIISLGSITAMLVLIVLDAYFMIQVLKKIKEEASYEKVISLTYKEYLQRLELIIVFLIIAVVFTFMPEVSVFSIGMALFYGIISMIIANLVFMRTMLLVRHNK